MKDKNILNLSSNYFIHVKDILKKKDKEKVTQHKKLISTTNQKKIGLAI